MVKQDPDFGGLSEISPLRAIWQKSYRFYAASVILLEILGSCALIASPFAQKILIDGINAADRQRTLHGILLTALLLALTLLCQTGSYLLRFRFSVEVRCRLKSAIFHCLLGLPESFLQGKGSGYFFNRVQADSSEVVRFYAGNALLHFSDFFKFLLALTVIAFLHWRYACFLLPFLFLQYRLYLSYRKKQYRIGYRIQECTASERYRMQEYLSAHNTLKTHNAASRAAEKIEQGFIRWRTLAFQRLFHENRFHFFLLIPYYFCVGVIALYGVNQILLHRLSLGGLWALLLLIRQVFSPMQRFALARFQMQLACASWDRLRQIVRDRDTKETQDENVPVSLKGDISVSRLDFSYAADRPLLRDLNFTVKADTLFLLTGENGSGKSTLFQLLLRLYAPQKGEILIGGKNIRDIPLTAYRSRIGYLGQTPEFFPGTVRENLLLGSRRSDEQIMTVMRLLKSESLILDRSGGLDASVSESGKNFSGGEKVRLALARELLRDTDILLLDEPAASLDYQARSDFYELLQKLPGDRTVIAIIHDPVLLPEKCARFQLTR